MTKNPGGKGTVTPYVAVRGAAEWLEFVEWTFGTEQAFKVLNEDGTVGHAEVTVGDSVLMAFDAKAEWPDTPSLLSVFVDDVDAVLARALEAGASVVTELTTSRIVGDRGCRIKDPQGNIWWLQTHLYDVDPASLPELFADPAEAAAMKVLQDSFDAEMRSRR
ncbi:MAG: PhnB protein [Kribbellaceae bacterium]|nr:PhnB protein [Kribbellaceae bacterium]